VQRVAAGESIAETFDFSQTPIAIAEISSEEKIECLAEIICRADNKSAAALGGAQHD